MITVRTRKAQRLRRAAFRGGSFSASGAGSTGAFLGWISEPLKSLILSKEISLMAASVGLGLGLLVGLDDLLDQGVADDVPVVEVAEADLLEAGQDLDGLEDAGLARLGEVDLGDVGRDDQLRVEAGPGQDHLH